MFICTFIHHCKTADVKDYKLSIKFCFRHVHRGALITRIVSIQRHLESSIESELTLNVIDFKMLAANTLYVCRSNRDIAQNASAIMNIYDAYTVDNYICIYFVICTISVQHPWALSTQGV